MGQIVVSVVAGAAVGSLNHWLLVRSLSVGHRGADRSANGLTALFALRYAIVALALLVSWLRFRSGLCEVVLALVAVWTGRLLLHRTLSLGGDRP